jgi:hypothetical protein
MILIGIQMPGIGGDEGFHEAVSIKKPQHVGLLGDGVCD